MIASSSDIRAAIRVYYGGSGSTPKQPVAQAVKVEHLEARASAPPEEPKVPPPPAKPKVAEAKPPSPPPSPPAQKPAPAKPTPSKPTYDDAPEIEAKHIPIPPRKKGRAIALTFLDGTKINLPAPRVHKKARIEAPTGDEAEELTARDLVSALRAVSHGAEASEILGENPRWEAMFAALLSLLLRKHLIADWEFVEEFRKV